MKKLSLLLPLFILVSCGDKHTFDTPQSGSGTGFNRQIQTKDFVVIDAHEEASDYYPEFFHAKYLNKIAAQESFSDQERTKLKSTLNDILRKDHVRVEGKLDALKRCTRDNTQSNSCYGHTLDTYRDYKKARTYMYGLIDLKTNSSAEYYLETIYCQKDFTSADLGNPQFAIGPMKRPDYNTINAEHVWPRSKFDEPNKETDYYNLKLSDLHNLFPSFVKTNQERWNYEFGNYAAATDVLVNDFSKYCANSTAVVFNKGGDNLFEAPDNVKGDIARAMFYMATRHYYYKKPQNMTIDAEEEAVLRGWHELDPVDAKERERNNKIFSVQHNRNPFVDYPELVDIVKDF